MNVYGPVKLSKSLRTFLEYTYSKMIDEITDVELRHAVAMWREPDWKDIGDELNDLVAEWTLCYDIRSLLTMDKSGLASHMKAEEIGINHEFELDGPQGDGGGGIRKHWKRIENPIDERVLAIVTHTADGTNGKVDVFEPATVVRPHCDCSRIETPEEIADRKQRWIDYVKASDLIDKRVHDHILQHDTAEIKLSYSCYETDERGVPIDNLDEIAIEGKAIIIQLSDYKEENFEDYESPVVENPTWLDMCVLFNQAISKTGDDHHCFLEGVYETSSTRDGIPVYRFATGS